MLYRIFGSVLFIVCVTALSFVQSAVVQSRQSVQEVKPRQTVDEKAEVLKLCNRTNGPIAVAFGQVREDLVTSVGWWILKIGECAPRQQGTTSYFAQGRGRRIWSGALDTKSAYHCLYARAEYWQDGARPKKFVRGESPPETLCASPSVPTLFRNFTAQELTRNVDVTLQSADRREPLLNSCVVQEQNGQARKIPDGAYQTVCTPTGLRQLLKKECVVQWDDSHNVHAVDVIINWDYQAVKTTMKKLHHCLEISVWGPNNLQIDEIAEKTAQNLIDTCTTKALNDAKVKAAFELILGAVADWFGGGGAGTAAALNAAISELRQKFVSCVTDSETIKDELGKIASDFFQADIRERTEWIYWEL